MGKDDGYGKKLVCKPVYDTIYKEKCTDVPDQHCNAVLTNQQKRKCFEVEEVVCKLREDVKYQTVQVGFTVQKCNKVQERVCDTVYDVTSSTKEKNICINVHNPYCKHEEKTIIDRTCRTSTKFDCPTEYGYGKDSYGKGEDYGEDYGKDYKKPECHKSSSTSCYDTPRTVIVPKCSTTTDKVCETVHQRYPDVSERQHCHNEDKKVCQLEERTQPKQVKKYVYTKQCRKVPSKVCENADNKSLVPSCVPSVRKECTYHPVESCDEVPKKHCYRVGKQVKKEKCEEYKEDYPAPAPEY